MLLLLLPSLLRGLLSPAEAAPAAEGAGAGAGAGAALLLELPAAGAALLVLGPSSELMAVGEGWGGEGGREGWG